MKITHIRFHNHIKLGDFDLDLRDPIISIVGKNGSGKSFLISELQPYPTSSRYSSAYSIIKQEVGFKEIIFQDAENTIIIRHEYTPNPKGNHSVKSYFMRNGMELNETGHGGKFKELCKEYLAFDHKTEHSSHVSFKTNGLTDSSTKARRELLSDIVTSEDLIRMQKNSVTELRATNLILQRLKDQKSMMGTFRNTRASLDELKNHVQETIPNRMQACETEISILEQEILQLQTILQETSSYSEEENQQLRILVQSLQGFSQEDVPFLLEQHSKQSQQQMEQLAKQIEYHQEKYEQDAKLFRLQEDIRSWNTILSQTRLDADRQKKALLEYITPQVLENGLYEALNALECILDYHTKVRSCTYVSTTSHLLESWNETKKKYQQYQEFLQEYQKNYINSDGGTVYEVEPCPSDCELYRKYVTSGNYVMRHRKEAEETEQEVLEMERDFQTLNSIPQEDTWNMTKQSYEQYFQPSTLDSLGMTTWEAFLQQVGMPSFQMEVQTIYETIKTLYDRYQSCVKTCEEMEYKISSISNIEIVVEDPKILLEELDRLRNQFQQIQRAYRKYEIPSNISSSFYHTTKQELEMMLQTRTQRLLQVEDRKQQLFQKERKRKEIKQELLQLQQEIIQLRLQIEDKERVAREIESLSKEQVVLQRCRFLLEKEIPLMLLSKSLTFMQQQTNHILQANQIPIHIDIRVDDTSIFISAIVNEDYLVEDISRLSSGEICLVSLIMNACVLHLIGYPILCLDEVDANLDGINRKKFSQIIESLLTILRIDQIICISHSVESMNDMVMRIVVGDPTGLQLSKNKREQQI